MLILTPLVIAALTAPSPQPSCPDVASFAVQRLQPTAPELARQPDSSGIAVVRVDLDAEARILRLAVVKSSGNVVLDRATMAAAARTRYAPAIRDCRSVPDSYWFVARFDSGAPGLTSK